MAIHAFTTSGLRRAVIASAHLVSEAAPAVLGAGLFLLSALTLAQPEHLHDPAKSVRHHHASPTLLLASAKAGEARP
ncbi:hypothetical protein [Gluconobacter albidus]|uniref:Uncharacterized protein n=1 Tax=Gluconobacter albidus TaxID=318683 RepID=A0AAW3QTZ0_9PROT|nr:hypothetical protein [Gluconobacter albidus]KXV36871.1 hypothetical protein AD941_13400 [Gluconobacter albidus]GBQ87432.1 hypothetical protein AA3250_1300 [Gluconobacter albidus NBRC 3250]GLQ70094.1 hypothetical protein GCM10007866_25470 [Gluconobacter albidus]